MGYFDLVGAKFPLYCWTFEDVAGVLHEASGRYEATCNPNTSAFTFGAASPINGVTRSISNDTGNFIVTSQRDLMEGADNHPAVTIEAIFLNSSVPNTTWACVLRNGSGSGFYIQINGNGRLSAYGGSQAGESLLALQSATSFQSLNVPYHVLSSFNFTSGDCRMWINGALIAEVLGHSFASSTYQHSSADQGDYFGGAFSSSFKFRGQMAAAAGYAREFTSAEALEHYRAALATFEVAGEIELDGSPASRVVTAARASDGAFLGRAVSDGGTGAYTIPIADAGPVTLTCTDDYGKQWAASEDIEVGDIRIPTPLNGRWYQATVAGTTGGSQPAWPTDGTPEDPKFVSDGGVTWQDMGPMREPLIIHPFLPEPA